MGGAVQSFTAILSEKAKEIIFNKFSSGEIKILCATEAVGMGCNVKDIEVVVGVGVGLQSLSVLVQRWGRAAWGFRIAGTCILLMPKWAWEPTLRPMALPQQVTQKQGKTEPK